MKIRIFVIFIVVGIALTGCTKFRVKNIDGLELAYGDIYLAHSGARELKSLQNVPEKQMHEARKMYNEAQSSVNSYLDKTITEAAGSFKVEKTADSYSSTSSNEKIIKFRRKVSEIGGFSIMSVDLLPEIILSLLGKIKELHDKEQEAAYLRFKSMVEENKMKNFEDLPARRSK